MLLNYRRVKSESAPNSNRPKDISLFIFFLQLLPLSLPQSLPGLFWSPVFKAKLWTQFILKSHLKENAQWIQERFFLHAFT